MTAAASSEGSAASGPAEFQAVVLAAGRGSRFTELTRHKPKCFLPVGNLPLVWFPLDMLHRAGFQEVIVVTHEGCRAEMSSLPKRHNLDVKLDVVCVPPSTSIDEDGEAEDDFGTADALRLVSDRLTSPRILVVSCDLVSDVRLQHLADLHRVRGAAVTALFAPASASSSAAPTPVPGPKTKRKAERDLVGLDPESAGGTRMLLLSAEADLEEEVSVRRTLLTEHPRVAVRTDLADAHLYVFDRWVLDYLKHNEELSNLKSDVVPFLVKSQFSKSARPPEDAADASAATEDMTAEERRAQAPKKALYPFLPSDKMSSHCHALSSWSDHSRASRPLRCHAHVVEGGGAVCARANNLHTYVELNRQASRIIACFGGGGAAAGAVAGAVQYVHPAAQVQPKAQLGPECFVGPGTLVSDRTTTKHSSLGANCRVEEKVRLTNSIVMDSVTLKEGCTVSGSVVCDGSVVPERCEIKDCIVGRGFEFKAGAKHSNEVLMNLDDEDRMMEI